MDALREKFDGVYDSIKPGIFWATAWNPEIAHHLFVNSLRGINAFGLSELILDNKANRLNPGYDIANGAGFNKNGEIDPRLMRLLGFDRVVVGTVTADPWKGNPKPRIKRFVETGSLVNWMGLPGIGAKRVARKLEKYGDHGVPLTVNLMATPDPEMSDADKLNDLRYTVSTLKDYVNSFELNISCPNTHGRDGKIDARRENLSRLDDMVSVVREGMKLGQSLYLKASPDSSEADVDDIVTVGEKYLVNGYTTANTTTNHYPMFVTQKMEKGGASGNAVWDASTRTQRYFADRVGKDVRLIACGGINSVERAKERCGIGNCKEIQIFTGLIFEGTGLMRKLRAG